MPNSVETWEKQPYKWLAHAPSTPKDDWKVAIHAEDVRILRITNLRHQRPPDESRGVHLEGSRCDDGAHGGCSENERVLLIQSFT